MVQVLARARAPNPISSSRAQTLIVKAPYLAVFVAMLSAWGLGFGVSGLDCRGVDGPCVCQCACVWVRERERVSCAQCVCVCVPLRKCAEKLRNCAVKLLCSSLKATTHDALNASRHVERCTMLDQARLLARVGTTPARAEMSACFVRHAGSVHRHTDRHTHKYWFCVCAQTLSAERRRDSSCCGLKCRCCTLHARV
jgi:hypothetical protein